MKLPLFTTIFFGTAVLFSQTLSVRHSAPVFVDCKDNAKSLSLPLLHARYQWHYVDINHRDHGDGTLSIFVDPTNNKVALDIMSFGKRIVLLRGDSIVGYRLRIPSYGINQKVVSLSMVPIPFFSGISNFDALYQFFVSGFGKGVKVISQDINGPTKLQYDSFDENGSKVLVRLKRISWKLDRK